MDDAAIAATSARFRVRRSASAKGGTIKRKSALPLSGSGLRVMRLRTRLVQRLSPRASLFMRRFGLEVRRLDQPPRRIARICERLSVSLVVDVGANDGSWASAIRGAGYEGSILSFEPNPEAFEILSHRAMSDERWETRPFAIGDREGTADLRLSPDSRWSSLLPAGAQNPLRLGGTKTIAAVRLRRLDQELAGANERIFLKIDTEGFDLHALRGVVGVAQSVVAGQVEVAVASHFVGQPSTLELLTELESLGLGVAGVENGFIDAGGAERYFNVLFERDELDGFRTSAGSSSKGPLA